MIYNKSADGRQELQRYLGFTAGNFPFDRLESYIVLAGEELARIFSAQVYLAVEDYYHSADYKGGLSADNLTHKDIITQHFQRAAGAYAYLKYAPNGDLSHDSGGRKINMEGEQRAAFSDQIARSDNAISDLFSTSVNTIYDLLEGHPEAFPQWRESPAYLRAADTLLPTARIFSDAFDIGGSYFLFYKLSPSIRIQEATYIRPLLGDKYAQVRDDVQMSSQLSVMARRALAVRVIADNITKGSFAYYARNIIAADASPQERTAEYMALMKEYEALSREISALVVSQSSYGTAGVTRVGFENKKENKYVYIPNPNA